jgi:hypothetical protein
VNHLGALAPAIKGFFTPVERPAHAIDLKASRPATRATLEAARDSSNDRRDVA